MINPTKLLKMKGLWEKFNNNHPKVMPFFNAANSKGITEGTIIEVKVKYPDETEYTTNVKVTQEDLELFHQVSELNR
ncbi:MAG: hypothetical protein ACLRZ9_03205 [Eubacterium sp.]